MRKKENKQQKYNPLLKSMSRQIKRIKQINMVLSGMNPLKVGQLLSGLTLKYILSPRAGMMQSWNASPTVQWLLVC